MSRQRGSLATELRQLVLGTIHRAHGVRGEMRMSMVANEEPPVNLPVRVVLKRGAVVLSEDELVGMRPANDVWLIRLKSVVERNGAELLRGAEVWVREDALLAQTPGDAFVFELEGAQVVDEQGQSLGQVSKLIENPGHDLLEITTAKGAQLLPWVPEFVVRFERAEHTLIVRVPDGLWDD